MHQVEECNSRAEPGYLSERIIRAVAKRQIELVIPWKARILFTIAQLFPSCGDWLLTKFVKMIARSSYLDGYCVPVYSLQSANIVISGQNSCDRFDQQLAMA